jgi:hypothetical protein
MSMLLSMLQAAGGNAKQIAKDRADQVAKHKVTMEARSKRLWGALFAGFGGRASTNQIAGKMGRAAASILKAMYGLEEKGWVKRAGFVEKVGPGKAQIIWEWLL